MHRFWNVLILGFLLVGCAGTKVVAVDRSLEGKPLGKLAYQLSSDVEIEASDFESLDNLIIDQLSGNLANSSSQATTNVKVTVREFRMRPDAARFLVGILAGTDNILSEVSVTDIGTGKEIANFTVKSLNDTAWGSSASLLSDHAEEIASYLIFTSRSTSQSDDSGSGSQQALTEDFYGQAEQEMNDKTYDKNLWAKALVDAEGDEMKRKAKYIELRANQLYSEKVGSTSNVAPDVQLDSYSGVSGTYRSKLSKNLYNYFKRPIIEIRLVQNGNKITGTFVTEKGYIDGEIDGNTIKYVAHPRYGTWPIRGEWVFTDGYNKATGDAAYHVTKGFWSLKKIE